MPQVKANGPIDHDGERYEKGDVFEVTAEQAAQLVESGDATAADADSTPAEPAPETDAPKQDEAPAEKPKRRTRRGKK